MSMGPGVLLLFPTGMEQEIILQEMGPGGASIHHRVIGVGPIAAAVSTASLLAEGGVELVVLAGIAGAYRGNPGGLGPGDVCIAESEAVGDLARCGAEGIFPILIDGVEVAMTFDLSGDVALVERRLGRSIPAAGCPMATVSCASGDAVRAEEVARRTSAWVENMEGAAVAAAAGRFGVPLLEVRGVSNWAGDCDHSRWCCETALRGVAQLLGGFLLH